MPRRARPQQLDLMDWEPPPTTVAFEPRDVRGATLAARISRAVSICLADCRQGRDAVAQRMSDYLGERVSLPMLNGYAAPSRPDHSIPVTRLVALIHATGDRRLLELLAEIFDWAVVERRVLALIDVAEISLREDELRQRKKALLRQAGKR